MKGGICTITVPYTNSQIKGLIQEHLHSQRDRGILFDRLVNGITFERLAEKHGLSERQVKTIVYKGEEVLFRHLKDS